MEGIVSFHYLLSPPFSTLLPPPPHLNLPTLPTEPTRKEVLIQTLLWLFHSPPRLRSISLRLCNAQDLPPLNTLCIRILCFCPGNTRSYEYTSISICRAHFLVLCICVFLRIIRFWFACSYSHKKGRRHVNIRSHKQTLIVLAFRYMFIFSLSIVAYSVISRNIPFLWVTYSNAQTLKHIRRHAGTPPNTEQTFRLSYRAVPESTLF